MPTDKPRITFTLDEDTLKAVEDYKFKYRIKNQSQAILSLMELGMDSLEAKFAEAEKLKEEIEDEYNATYNLSSALGKEKPSAFGRAKGDEVKPEEMYQLLRDLGYLREGDKLRMEDIDFMIHIFGMLDAWFTSRKGL